MKTVAKSSSGKVMVAVLIVAVLAIACVGSVWYYMDTQLKAQQARAQSLQNQIASQANVAQSAYLDLTPVGTFDFTVGIDANGGVAVDGTANDPTPPPTLDIVNLDTTRDASSVYVTMWDPVSSTGGLPLALEDKTLSIYVTWNGITTPLYLTVGGIGTYSTGVLIGTIPHGASVSTITFSGIVDAAPDNTYDDSGATYTIHVFVYQSNAGTTTPVSFTLET